jgi:hypothetical protein
MARTALIDNTTTVVSVIEAPSGYIAPGGETVVESDTANIGDTYSGGVFTPPYTVATNAQMLLVQASQQQARVMSGGISVDVGGGVIADASTGVSSQTTLHSATWQAQANPAQTFAWSQNDGSTMTLTAEQIITINAAVSDFVQATYDTLASINDAINAGTITTIDEVITPPSGVLPWPPNS